ncbi:MAG: hypothetical protein ACOC80_09225 [Petrotogales bacterium]
MTDYYIIPPFPDLQHYEYYPYHMVIGPLLKDYPEYIDFYKDKTTIIDNGEYEGMRCDIEQLLDIADKIDADEVVLPDEIGNKQETLELVNEVLPKVTTYDFDYMGVAQGNDVYEVIECAKKLYYVLEVDIVALPVHVSKMESGYRGRGAVMDFLDFEVHFLGLYNPRELTFTYPRSIDTSYPFKIAQSNMELGDICDKKLDFKSSSGDVKAREFMERYL